MKSKSNKFFDEKIREIAKEKTVWDLGSGFAFKKGLKRYKDCFRNCDYKRLDYNSKYNPDIVGDLHNLPFETESIDAIICKEVLQCVDNPNQVASEIYRVLKVEGKCYVEVPFIACYQGNGSCEDQYRFTEKGVRNLFKNFKTIEVCPISGQMEAIAYLFPCQRWLILKAIVILAKFIDIITEKWQSKKQVSGLGIFLIK